MRAEPNKSKLTISELLEKIVVCITKSAKRPFIEYDEEDRLLSFRVIAKDHGRCVGKQGAVIAGIARVIWLASVIRDGRPIAVRLMDPEGPRMSNANLPVIFDPQWDRKSIGNLIESIIESIVPTSAWIIDEDSETTAIVTIQIEEYLKRALMDPPFELSLFNVLRAAGMSAGVSIKLKIEWR